MATLILGAAGSAIGSVFGGVGLILGRTAGALAGHAIDQALFGGQTRQGPRLADLEIQSSTEGSPIPRIYGRARLAGQIIWATAFEEETKKTTQGGKGGPSVTTIEYSYFGNFALGLCDGPIARIGRIWADGKLLDTSGLTIRVYHGTEVQDADPLILAKQGSDVPAYRGTAYIVFERLPLVDFGNRIPQLSFEVDRPVAGIADHVRAVCLIPGSTEFGYDTQIVASLHGPGKQTSLNAHADRNASDWTVSLDELQALCPKLEWVSLVVAWFGDDLRAGACTITPRVDDKAKATSGGSWAVSGESRSSATAVSLVDGRPAYGGTPDDASVIRAIQDLKSRGLKVVLLPFILMDIAGDNTQPDPYTGLPGQPAYPWRGRITCDPAPGTAGTADKTAAAGAQVSAFVGAAQPGDFTASGTSVSYSGPAEWSYRRFVLHYAHLADLAGGVDGFAIGSEMVALTTVRDSQDTFPFVAGLASLATDIRFIVGAPTALTYAADWSEYFGHQPADGSGDVYFHLDPLWADAAIDAVGIDVYFPLADWRDGISHADETSGRAQYHADYLRGNLRAGEGFDWYYASPADRDAQIRTPITDGAGKPWVFRFKDLESWWSNAHFDRPGGVENVTPTPWQAQSKPIWFTEVGCPAIDKGANQPNVFFDPKSAQSALPYYSGGGRDDSAQLAYLHAVQTFFEVGHPDFAGSNPLSSLYGGPMVDAAHLHLWAWDARPYPFFPRRTDLWADGPSWERGHWLNGRLGAAELRHLIAAILADHGFADFAIEDVYGVVAGYVVNARMSARNALDPLLAAFGIDAGETGTGLLFRARNRPIDVSLAADSVIDRAGEALRQQTRAQETELASEIVLRVLEPENDYRMTAAASRRLTGQSRRSSTIDLTAVLAFSEAEKLADQVLTDIWAGREQFAFSLPPSSLAIEAGDIIAFDPVAANPSLLVDRIEDGGARSISARIIDRRRMPPLASTLRGSLPDIAAAYGAPEVRILEIAPPPDGSDAQAPRLAIFADPWPGQVAVYAGSQGGGFALRSLVQAPAVVGALNAALAPGHLGVFDRGNVIDVAIFGGALSALPDIDVLAGGNLAAIRAADGDWELLQFADAELIAANSYRLTRLIRGQGGSEAAMLTGASVGADFVLIDAAVETLPVGAESIGIPLRFRFGPARDDFSGPTFIEQTITAAGRGLKPFSPVHLNAARDDASGDVAVSWIRRTRFGGDSWDSVEVPLNEDAEAYRLEVLDAGTPVRSQVTASPAYLYAAADQIADFGAPQAAYTIRVAQLSATAGAGFTLTETLNV